MGECLRVHMEVVSPMTLPPLSHLEEQTLCVEVSYCKLPVVFSCLMAPHLPPQHTLLVIVVCCLLSYKISVDMPDVFTQVPSARKVL